MKKYFDRLTSMERRFVAGVFLVVIVAVNLVFVLPHFSDWRKVQSRLKSARARLANYEREISQKAKYTTELKSLESEDMAVPLEDQDVAFLGTVQRQAADSHVNITGNNRPTMTTNQFFVERAQTFNVQSGEKQLVDFLYKLGSGNSTIRVRILGLRPDPPRQQLNASVGLVASYQKKLAARATATAAAPTPAKPAATPAPAKPPATTPAKPAGKPTPGARPTAPSTDKPSTPTKR